MYHPQYEESVSIWILELKGEGKEHISDNILCTDSEMRSCCSLLSAACMITSSSSCSSFSYTASLSPCSLHFASSSTSCFSEEFCRVQYSLFKTLRRKNDLYTVLCQGNFIPLITRSSHLTLALVLFSFQFCLIEIVSCFIQNHLQSLQLKLFDADLFLQFRLPAVSRQL